MAQNNNPYNLPQIKKDGYPRSSVLNLHIILSQLGVFDEIYFNVIKQQYFWYDSISAEKYIAQSKNTSVKSKRQNTLQLYDTDINNIQLAISSKYGLDFDTYKIVSQIQSNCQKINPIQEYLNNLPEWDGVRRLPTLLIDYLGAEDKPIYRIATQRFFVGAVARGLTDTGVKMDNALVLYSATQGIGKSTLIRKLCFDEAYYTDNLNFGNMKDKSGAEIVGGCWLVEIGEMRGSIESNADTVKQFISSSVDTYRPVYGRYPINQPRRCVFIGTTNEQIIYNDQTGNRRWWCITCGNDTSTVDKINKEIDKNFVDQFWAEAKHFYDEGMKWYLTAEESKLMEEQANQFTYKTDRYDDFIDYLNTPIPVNYDDLSPSQRHNWWLDVLRQKAREVNAVECYDWSVVNKTTQTEVSTTTETMERQSITVNDVLNEFFQYELSIINIRPLDSEVKVKEVLKLLKQAKWTVMKRPINKAWGNKQQKTYYR